MNLRRIAIVEIPRTDMNRLGYVRTAQMPAPSSMFYPSAPKAAAAAAAAAPQAVQSLATLGAPVSYVQPAPIPGVTLAAASARPAAAPIGTALQYQAPPAQLQSYAQAITTAQASAVQATPGTSSYQYAPTEGPAIEGPWNTWACGAPQGTAASAETQPAASPAPRSNNDLWWLLAGLAASAVLISAAQKGRAK